MSGERHQQWASEKCLSTNVWLHRRMEQVVTSLTSLQNCKPHLVLAVISFFWIQSYVWESFGEPREDPGGSRGQPPRPNDVFRLGQVRCQNSPASGPFPRRISSSTEVQVLNSRASPAHPYHRFGTATSWEFDLTWSCVHFFCVLLQDGKYQDLVRGHCSQRQKSTYSKVHRFTFSSWHVSDLFSWQASTWELNSWLTTSASWPTGCWISKWCRILSQNCKSTGYISLYIPLISPLLLLYPH